MENTDLLNAMSLEEKAAAIRFCDCCEDFDAGGYDVPSAKMKRLAEIGLVKHRGGGWYEGTERLTAIEDDLRAELESINKAFLANTNPNIRLRAAIADPHGDPKLIDTLITAGSAEGRHSSLFPAVPLDTDIDDRHNQISFAPSSKGMSFVTGQQSTIPFDFTSSLPRPTSPEAIEQIKKAVKEFRTNWQPAGKKPSLAQTYQLVAKAMGFKTWEAMIAAAENNPQLARDDAGTLSVCKIYNGVAPADFEQLKDMDHRLVELEDLVQHIVTGHGEKPYWCANYYWYGLIKPQLLNIVGWARNKKPSDYSAISKEIGGIRYVTAEDLLSTRTSASSGDPLATSNAYDLAYRALESMLPDCKHKEGCPPYADLANTVRLVKQASIHKFLVDCIFTPSKNRIKTPYIPVIKKLLSILDEYGDCPSVISSDGYTGDTFEKLSKISLLDHSLRVARLSVRSSIPRGVDKGEAVIAALAHDLGKIKEYSNEHQPSGVNHAWISTSVLGGLSEFFDIPKAQQGRAEFVLSAVAGHHDSADKPNNRLCDWIFACDGKSRIKEGSSIKSETEESFFQNLASQCARIDAGKRPKQSGKRLSMPKA